MDASSPRSIQNSLDHQSSAMSKALHTSPLSSVTAPSSYNSDIDKARDVTLHGASEQSSASVSDAKPSQNGPHGLKNLPLHPSNVQKLSPLALTRTARHGNHICENPQNRSWLSTLLSTKFYGPCHVHSDFRKNDLNLFCITHAEKICQFCHQAEHSQKTSSGQRCTVLHVSRYMYHDVLLAKEAGSLLDLEHVQSYLNNGNRVVYMDRRAQAKSRLAPHAKACTVCSRTLQDPFLFCSVFCRLAHVNDPAAEASLPVPDASPLLQQAPRKPKSPTPQSSSQSKRTERYAKKLEACLATSANASSPVATSPKRSVDVVSPPAPSMLQLTGVKKRSRRKGVPVRSPSASPEIILLFDGSTFGLY